MNNTGPIRPQKYARRALPLRTQAVVSTRDIDSDSAIAKCPASMWMAVFLAFLVGRASEWIPGMSVVPLSRIAFLIAALVAYQNRSTLSQVLIRDLPNIRSGLWFMGLAICSVAFSVYISKSLTMIPGPITLALSMFLLVKVTPTIGDLRRLLVAVVVAGIALVFATLRAYQGGRAQIGTEYMSYDPNDLAYVLVSIIPIALALYAQAKGISRILLAGSVVFMIFTILLTGSRGGAIGLFVVALSFALRPIALNKAGELQGIRLGGALIRLSFLAAAMGLAWLSVPMDVKDRLATLGSLGSDYNTSFTDNSSRLLVWSRDAKAVLQRPIGFGIGTAPAVDGLLGGNFKTAHNSLVQCLVELGFVGLILLLRSCYLSWRKLAKLEAPTAASSTKESRSTYAVGTLALFSRAMRTSLLGNFVTGMFLSQAYAPILWTLIGLTGAILSIGRLADRRTKSLPV